MYHQFMTTNIRLVRDDPLFPDDDGKVPKLNGAVGGSLPDREIISLLDRNCPGGQTHHMFQKRKRKDNKHRINYYGPILVQGPHV
jgi:hypothetical protein